MIIELSRIEVEEALNELVRYYGMMEEHSEAARHSEFEKVLDLEKQYSQTIEDPGLLDFEIQSLRATHIWRFDSFYPRCLRYSFVTLLVLVVETQLQELCDELHKRRNLPIRARDLDGRGIQRCLNYLKLLVKLEPSGIRHWEHIQDLGKIRNCIVHTLGKLKNSTDEKRVRELAVPKNGLAIAKEVNPSAEEVEILVIEPAFCKSAISATQEFFTDVFDKSGFGPSINLPRP